MEFLIISILFAFLCFILGVTIGFSGDNIKNISEKKEQNYKVELISYDDKKRYNLDIEVDGKRVHTIDVDSQAPLVVYNHKCQIRKI